MIETQHKCVTPESEEKCEKKEGLTGDSSGDVPTNAETSHTCKCADKG